MIVSLCPVVTLSALGELRVQAPARVNTRAEWGEAEGGLRVSVLLCPLKLLPPRGHQPLYAPTLTNPASPPWPQYN